MNMQTPANTTVPAYATARAAGLRHTGDHQPGIARLGKPGKFRYADADGQPVRDDDVLTRIKTLAIPPAWTDVWICPRANGHVQATGRDARGRKQYRYHARWRQVRDDVKYERMLSFGNALPAIRAAVARGMQLPGLPREKVLATIVHLLELTMMRIGNEEYARANKSFGLSTLRTRHVDIKGSAVQFHFKGKSGVRHDIRLSDRRLARVLQRMRDLPGQELFQYVDEDGERHSVDSGDVNDYLRAATGEDYTAKDFRTWSGTLLAALALQAFEQVDSAAQAKKNIVQAIESVAKKLGNTPTICRKCYVHPAVLESYLDGSLLEGMRARARQELREDLHALTPEEAAVLALLQQRLQGTAPVKPGVPAGAGNGVTA